IHCGARAAAAADALQARAFTLGPDIFFCSGQYASETPEGRRLLAHELVHVVQQGAERSGPGTYPVRLASDPLEWAAHRGAATVLASPNWPPTAKDRGRAIRRAVTVKPSTATITIKQGSITPHVCLYQTNDDGNKDPAVQTHLTANLPKGSLPKL